MIPADTSSTDRLRTLLRCRTGIDDLDWATAPVPLTGGFWAEMYLVEIAAPPTDLAGRLVARIMPDPATAELETAVQRHLYRCGLPVPAIRAAAGPTKQLDRAWMLMDHAPGQPILNGLTATSALRQAPALFRRMPDLLAESAAALHQCPIEGLEVGRGDQSRSPDIDDFLRRIVEQANSIHRSDLADTAERLASQTPGARVICHGDLHPFNLLVENSRWTLIDWSAAVIADPHYDLAFTSLMLANPPLGGPAPLRAAARSIGSRLAGRFLHTYQHLSGEEVDPDRLRWGRDLHALRALVEIATWEAHDELDSHVGHPWLTLRHAFEAQLRTR